MENIGKFGVGDFFLLILFLILIQGSISNGIISEILKTIGIIIAGFLSFHYYNVFSSWLEKILFFINKKFIETLSFILILITALTIFSTLRKLIVLFLKRKEFSLWERLIAFIIGVFRFSFTASVLIFVLSIFSFKMEYVKNNFSYNIFRNIGPWMYLNSIKLIQGNYNININDKIKDYYETEDFISRNNSSRD